MGKVIVVANQKGGVAKTTTAVNLAACLGRNGYSVLLIDLDPQGNATSGIGANKEELPKGIYEVLIEKETLPGVVVPTSAARVSAAPAQMALVGAELELVYAVRRESRLRDALSKNDHKNQYDFVIIDTPPSLGLLTVNAFTAADSVLIPMQCEYFALEGLAQLFKTIQLVKQKANPALAIEGVIFSMVDPRANLTVQVMEEVRKNLGDRVYETVIPRNVRLAEAPSFGKSILDYDVTSKGAEAYDKLAKEFLKRNGKTPAAASVDQTRVAEPPMANEAPNLDPSRAAPPEAAPQPQTAAESQRS